MRRMAPIPARASRNQEKYTHEPQGVYSHQTALTLHELTDVMPSRLHMTVPKTFRRGATIPKGLVICRGGRGYRWRAIGNGAVKKSSEMNTASPTIIIRGELCALIRRRSPALPLSLYL